MRSIVRFGLASASIAFGIVGACTFPDPKTEDPGGEGGAPTGTTTTTIVASSSGSAGTLTSSSSSSSSSAGGASSSSTSSSDGGGGVNDGGGGSSSSSDAGGGGSSSQGGGGSSSSGGGSEGGGGSGPVACGDGCVPSDDDDGDCDEDEDLNGTDCEPCNGDVFDGQPAYFDVPYQRLLGGTSYDYDCSGGATFEYVYEPDGCSGVPLADCEDDPIYVGGNQPACGQDAFVQACMQVGVVLATCDVDGAGSSTPARCH